MTGSPVLPLRQRAVFAVPSLLVAYLHRTPYGLQAQPRLPGRFAGQGMTDGAAREAFFHLYAHPRLCYNTPNKSPHCGR